MSEWKGWVIGAAAGAAVGIVLDGMRRTAGGPELSTVARDAAHRAADSDSGRKLAATVDQASSTLKEKVVGATDRAAEATERRVSGAARRMHS